MILTLPGRYENSCVVSSLHTGTPNMPRPRSCSARSDLLLARSLTIAEMLPQQTIFAMVNENSHCFNPVIETQSDKDAGSFQQGTCPRSTEDLQ